MQKSIEGDERVRMVFCKFHGTVSVKTFFLEIKILSAKLKNVYLTVAKIMAETQGKNFSSGGR